MGTWSTPELGTGTRTCTGTESGVGIDTGTRACSGFESRQRQGPVVGSGCGQGPVVGLGRDRDQ